MVIGITGGIGTGKSTVLNIMKERYGFYIFEADKIGHEIMGKGMDVHGQIIEEFGENIVDGNGEINRKLLSQIVFHDKKSLERLNHITHPGVIREIQRRMEIKRENGIERFVIEAALLIESGCASICDKIWYIYSEDSVRIERLKHGRGMSEEEISRVMKNQLKYDEFVKKTDAIVDNSFSTENTCLQIEKLLEF